MNTCATQPLRASCSALHWRNDKDFRLRPKWKPIRSVLINGLCNFEDVTKPPTASLWRGLFDVHSFKEHLYTHSAHSKWSYTRTLLIRSVLINGMCLFKVSVRKANAEISAELDGCTSDCAVLLATVWRTKRGGITRGRYLSMRVPTSPLRAMCS